jgi:hypothetical protein
LQVSDGSAWLVRVFDREGRFIDRAVADDPEEAVLAVAERPSPPRDARE